MAHSSLTYLMFGSLDLQCDNTLRVQSISTTAKLNQRCTVQRMYYVVC